MPEQNSFAEVALKNVNGLYILFVVPSILISIISYMGVFVNDVSLFCQNPGNLVKDPFNELGPKGDIVRWLTVLTISLIVIPILISITVPRIDQRYSQFLIFASFVYLTTWEIIGIEKIFSNRIPVECIDYKMGNNFPYVIMLVVTELFFVGFTISAFLLLMFYSFGITFGIFGNDAPNASSDRFKIFY